MTPPRTTAVVVTWNAASLAPDLAWTLDALRPVLADAVISDNASTDPTPETLRSALPWAVLSENPRNGGFGYGCNRGLERVRSPFVLLLNADARIAPEDLLALEETLEADPGAAAVQPLIRLWGWPLVTLSAGAAMTPAGEGYDLDCLRFQPAPDPRRIHVPAVTAAVSLWRTDALRQVGGFDEGFFMYFEDVDLCLRLRAAGYRFLLDPSSAAEHRMGASSSRVSALAWELESSTAITRRYLGGTACALPRSWWRRELRIRAATLARGRGIGWRMAAVRRARARALAPVTLPPGDLAWMVEPRPLREPVARPPVLPEEALDREGRVLRGPGWDASGATTACGFGCLTVPWTGGELEVELRRLDGPCTAALWLDVGIAARILLAGDRPARIRGAVPPGGGRVWVVPDRRECRIALESCSFLSAP